MAGPTAEQRVTTPILRAAWVRAAFVHWPVPAEEIQALLPDGLSPDLHDGSAWLSLVPHVMTELRPLGLPLLPNLRAVSESLPDLSGTAEINVRTYVRGPDGRDGVWFFSVDAANSSVVAAVRAFVGAPYFSADVQVEEGEGLVRYTGARSNGPERWELAVRPGGSLEPSERDVWLTGRWRAYTRHVGRLWVTPIEHEPWPLRSATLGQCSENLTVAAGLPGPSDPVVHFSDGVRQVRIGLPRTLR